MSQSLYDGDTDRGLFVERFQVLQALAVILFSPRTYLDVMDPLESGSPVCEGIRERCVSSLLQQGNARRKYDENRQNPFLYCTEPSGRSKTVERGSSPGFNQMAYISLLAVFDTRALT